MAKMCSKLSGILSKEGLFNLESVCNDFIKNRVNFDSSNEHIASLVESPQTVVTFNIITRNKACVTKNMA